MTVVTLEQYRNTLPKCGYIEFNMLGDRTYWVVVRDGRWQYKIIGGFRTCEAAGAALKKMLRQGAR